MQYTETVVFVSYEARSVNTRFGAKTVTDFVDNQNRKFSSWKAEISTLLAQTIGQPIAVTFEAKQNGDFVNYDVKSAMLANGAPAPAAAAPAPGAQAAPVQQAAPAQSAPPPQNNGVTGAEKDARISRAAALDRALTAFGISQEDPLVNPDALYELSDEYFSYITTGSPSAAPPPAVAQGPTV